jgi:DNA-directed RNA polymerase specialized sigma54-like protein
MKLLQVPTIELDQRIKQEIEENPEVDEEEEEEDVLASSKLMLKIAQKLDLKKKYRLADKLTYIIRKKT